jgi:hypothetical protein
MGHTGAQPEREASPSGLIYPGSSRGQQHWAAGEGADHPAEEADPLGCLGNYHERGEHLPLQQFSVGEAIEASRLDGAGAAGELARGVAVRPLLAEVRQGRETDGACVQVDLRPRQAKQFFPRLPVE